MRKIFTLLMLVMLCVVFVACDENGNNEDNENLAFDFDPETGTILRYYHEYGAYPVVPETIDGITVKTIGEGAFFDSFIYSIELPETLETIETKAFRQCLNLQHIEIPASVMTIEPEAFTLGVLVQVTIQGDETRFDSVWDIIPFPVNNPVSQDRLDVLTGFYDSQENSIKEIRKVGSVIYGLGTGWSEDDFENPPSENYTSFIFSIQENGEVKKVYPQEVLHDILQLDDLKASYKSIEVDPYGNLVVLCAYTYIDENDSKIRIMHNLIHVFDQELNLISEHDFYPEHLSLPWKIRFNTNGELGIMGARDIGYYRKEFILLDENYNLIYESSIPGNSISDFAADGEDFIFVGNTYNHNYPGELVNGNETDNIVSKISKYQGVVWSKRIESSLLLDEFRAISKGSDDAFYIVGVFYDEFGKTSQVIKINSDGYIMDTLSLRNEGILYVSDIDCDEDVCVVTGGPNGNYLVIDNMIVVEHKTIPLVDNSGSWTGCFINEELYFTFVTDNGNDYEIESKTEYSAILVKVEDLE